MQKLAGKDELKGIQEYQLGSITDTVYAVNGGMEDWGYAAGWDTYGKLATTSKCRGMTTKGTFRTAMFLFETDDNKNPDQSTYGGRQISTPKKGKKRVMPKSIYLDQFNGHINRNIRASMALIIMAKPFIYWEKNTQDRTKVALSFTIKGCIKIDSLVVEFWDKNGWLIKKIDYGEDYCEYGAVLGQQQKNKRMDLSWDKSEIRSWTNDTDIELHVRATVDQLFQTSLYHSEVEPRQFVNTP